jgi:hypothetical protein
LLRLRDLALVVGDDARLDALPHELALGAVLDALADVLALGLGHLRKALVELVDAALLVLAQRGRRAEHEAEEKGQRPAAPAAGSQVCVIKGDSRKGHGSGSSLGKGVPPRNSSTGL